MSDLIADFFHFLDHSPTAWHASKETADRLIQGHFTELLENERWQLEVGRSYFVRRDDAALIAFRMPKRLTYATILASHLDSPGLKLKPVPEVEGEFGQFATELYGSPLLHTWFDRDLTLAGRIFVQTREKIESHLVFLEDISVVIPSLPDHLNRPAAKKGLVINPEEHLKPIAHPENSLTLESLLQKRLSFEKMLSFDLFLVSKEKAAASGCDQSLIASARLDNLSSAYACLDALLQSQVHDALPMAVFWNHEEIGSKSCVGAESNFLNQVLERICFQQNMDREDFFRLKSRSYCVSVDLAHGFHPNYSDRFDPQNSPLLGQGVVLKTNANLRYATSASSSVRLIALCEKKNIPLQKLAFRSDISSGSTVGSIMSAIDGMPTVDIGIAGWAMHSIREVISARDELSLASLLQSLL